MARRSRAREVALQLLFQDDVNPPQDPADSARFLEARLNSEELVQFAAGLLSGVRRNRSELDEFYGDSREVKESVQKRLRKDAITSILAWQREQNLPMLAEAFGRSIVIPSFFLCKERRLLQFYRTTTEGITYRVAVPDNIL